jgi:phosphatidylserine decarboxylase
VSIDPLANQTIPDDPAPIIAREGMGIVAWFFAVAAVLSAAAFFFAAWLGAVVAVPLVLVACWSFWFFRDPARAIPAGANTIVSPADGVVSAVVRSSPPAELGIDPSVAGSMTRISVFMNVFNVHVNRAPEAGKVLRIAYRPGKFFNASFDKASEFNERCSYAMALPDGRPLVFVQIAGLIARRIVNRIEEGTTLRRGERFGLIRFGSRVDTYLPAGIEPLVKVGDKCVAGETVLARLAPVMSGASIEPRGLMATEVDEVANVARGTGESTPLAEG